jgi:hypothetical protein
MRFRNKYHSLQIWVLIIKTTHKGAAMSDKRAVTMDDIARLAQVSKPTVSRALNNSPLVKERTKNRTAGC